MESSSLQNHLLYRCLSLRRGFLLNRFISAAAVSANKDANSQERRGFPSFLELLPTQAVELLHSTVVVVIFSSTG
ncbi:hypothetical protein Bca4012_063747 [Brassica carinata]